MLDKYKNLVTKLLNATSQKALPWNKTSRENEYEAAVGDNSVSIKRHFKVDNIPDDKEFISLFVWNRFGDVVDEVRAYSYSEDFINLASLFDAAESAAIRAEDILDEILADISRIG
jgi:hypothetical protein